MSSSVFAFPVAGQPVRHGDRLPEDGRRRVSLRTFIGDDENPLLESLVAGATTISPMVFYGRSGVGKTHLALAWAQAWKARHPAERVTYVTGADWVRRYPATELQPSPAPDRGPRGEQPRVSSPGRWQSAKCLVVDDVDHLRDAPAAQYALSRRLDEAESEDAQVVVTSKVHPALISEFSPGLRSRLIGGLAIAVQPPGAAARMMIVQELALARGTRLPPDALAHVARQPGTAPELMGRLGRLEVAARLHDGPVDGDFIDQALSLERAYSALSLADVAAATARRFGIPVEAMLTASRRRALVTARGVFALLARELLGTSYAQLGRFLGGRDHSTVMHSCEHIVTAAQSDPCVAAAIGELRSALTAERT